MKIPMHTLRTRSSGVITRGPAGGWYGGRGFGGGGPLAICTCSSTAVSAVTAASVVDPPSTVAVASRSAAATLGPTSVATRPTTSSEATSTVPTYSPVDCPPSRLSLLMPG